VVLSRVAPRGQLSLHGLKVAERLHSSFNAERHKTTRSVTEARASEPVLSNRIVQAQLTRDNAYINCATGRKIRRYFDAITAIRHVFIAFPKKIFFTLSPTHTKPEDRSPPRQRAYCTFIEAKAKAGYLSHVRASGPRDYHVTPLNDLSSRLHIPARPPWQRRQDAPDATTPTGKRRKTSRYTHVRPSFVEDTKSNGKDSVWDAAARSPVTTGREGNACPRSLDEKRSRPEGIPRGGRLIE
jgi:hypothetical protein